MKLERQTRRGTLVGATAVLLWSLLALLTTYTGSVPPFQLTAMAFSVAALLGVAWWLQKKTPIVEQLKLPAGIWLLGIGGLFGYHFFYFMALRNAPAVEAGLIAYLWPLLIVLFSTLLPGETLRWRHTVGALLGFAGAGLLMTGGRGVVLDSAYLAGYLFAVICAFIWSAYSVLARRFGEIPTESVGGFCLATAVLAWGCHFAFEQTTWPAGAAWLAVLGLGVGPVGLAFFTWDYGVKKGDIQTLGALSYAAPLLSTLLLIYFGQAVYSWRIGAACLLIVGGAVLAARAKRAEDGARS